MKVILIKSLTLVNFMGENSAKRNFTMMPRQPLRA